MKAKCKECEWWSTEVLTNTRTFVGVLIEHYLTRHSYRVDSIIEMLVHIKV